MYISITIIQLVNLLGFTIFLLKRRSSRSMEGMAAEGLLILLLSNECSILHPSALTKVSLQL
jgi:hypothetical protein